MAEKCPDAPTITVDMDKPYMLCGHKGACPNGLCLSCITEAVQARAAKREQRKDAKCGLDDDAT